MGALQALLILLVVATGTLIEASHRLSGAQLIVLSAGGLGIAVFYVFFMTLGLQKLHSPVYLCLSSDGYGFWTPYFRRRPIQFEAGTVLRTDEFKISASKPGIISRGREEVEIVKIVFPSSVVPPSSFETFIVSDT